MSKKILLIEDDHDLSDVLRMRLEKTGYQVITLYDGTEAVRVAKEERPDLILLDLFMPETDGFTTLKSLKAERVADGGAKAIAEVPTIVMTGKAPMMEEMVRFEGAVEFLTKPVEINSLMKRIEELLK
ncbi:MAG: hypothetical protein COV74_10775 [Candidatus Omnitrophica bacterium CG11_big_fil_rev_8_21_14_0_20_45_26]|uniref:Response regulatory domain-containing protein n=1 Tax=Candidatus Abzuiibacterium crystallinum TaxID=1974748 RepID=A0A2H0LKX9_9BACT|nr:MAG: hypothetical protein COV74_10775 [Candidatus Omnitrophica bacterium CG11_big_fil_rev_8_21_14_0_20_45_26]PIW63851.1 MAG: hypothetical protein COW12_08035 [Candidatus Omnitrophica bacterium CG12_big_fil_rev_8_21_14_0_65_45_16]